MWNVAGEYLKLARKSSNIVQLKGFCMVEKFQQADVRDWWTIMQNTYKKLFQLKEGQY